MRYFKGSKDETIRCFQPQVTMTKTYCEDINTYKDIYYFHFGGGGLVRKENQKRKKKKKKTLTGLN